MGKLINISGQRFGRLVVVKHMGSNQYRQSVWLCRCDCGNEKVITSNQLRTGHTRSCGCLLTETIKTLHMTHGGTYHPLYQTWLGMKQRCSNPNHKDYNNYGGRGISVCERWKNDFGAFLHDLGERPGSNYTLDRIDVDGNYEPGNVRWATHKTQATNKPNCIILSLSGTSKPLTRWASELGISAGTLRNRYRNGWSDERILTTPVVNPSDRKRDNSGKWVTV